MGGADGGAAQPDTGGFLNDLWKYSVSGNEWIWIGGESTINPAYTGNAPSARYEAGSWTDNNGVFWLYGGIGINRGLNIYVIYGQPKGLCKYIPADNLSATISPANPALLTVYPNPGNGNFTVDLPEAAQVSIYNTLGGLIVTENLPKGKQPLNLTNKPAGVYYLKTNSSIGQQAVKLVVE